MVKLLFADLILAVEFLLWWAWWLLGALWLIVCLVVVGALISDAIKGRRERGSD